MSIKFRINIFKKLLPVVLLGGVAFLSLNSVVEAQNYKIHEKIPGQAGKSGVIDGVDYGEEGIDTLQDYLESAYKFGIAIVAILAVVMIGIGGFMYIVTSAGNAGKLANAKEIITSAILGLIMALLSWLILFVVNPDLVGKTLEGVSLDSSQDEWKYDGWPDPEICNRTDETFYETPKCSGGYFCVERTCVPKNSICIITNKKIEGVCSKNDFPAKTGDECGVATGKGTNQLNGICKLKNENGECESGWVEMSAGRQCVSDDAICCTSGL